MIGGVPIVVAYPTGSGVRREDARCDRSRTGSRSRGTRHRGRGLEDVGDVPPPACSGAGIATVAPYFGIAPNGASSSRR
jgi:hypothetical protein